MPFTTVHDSRGGVIWRDHQSPTAALAHLAALGPGRAVLDRPAGALEQDAYRAIRTRLYVGLHVTRRALEDESFPGVAEGEWLKAGKGRPLLLEGREPLLRVRRHTLAPSEVVAILLDRDPLTSVPPLPRAFQRALRSGLVRDLGDLLARGPRGWSELPGAGLHAVQQLERWIRLATRHIGTPLAPDVVITQALAVTPPPRALSPEPRVPTTFELASRVEELPEHARELFLLDLPVSNRVRNHLRQSGLARVRDLAGRPDQVLFERPGFGSRCRADLLEALDDIAGDETVKERARRLSWEAQEERLERVEGLTTRTRRVLRTAGVEQLHDLCVIPEARLRSVPGFGEACRANLLEVLERLEDEDPDAPRLTVHDSVRALVDALPAPARRLRLDDVDELAFRTRNALRRAGYERLEQLTRLPEEHLLRIRGLGEVCLRDLKRGVLRLIRELYRIEGPFATAEDVVRGLLRRRSLVEEVEARLASVDQDVGRELLRRRLLAEEGRETLQAIADDLGITRERVRQIEVEVRNALVGAGTLTAEVDSVLDRLRAGRGEPLTLSELERHDPWFAGASDRPRWFGGVLETLGCKHGVLMDPSLEGDVVTLAGTPTVQELAKELGRLLSGRPIDTDREPEAHRLLTERGVPELLPLLLERTAEMRRIDGRVYLKPTKVHRVMDVLERAGRPLTVPEIVQRLEQDGHVHSEGAVRSAVDLGAAVNTAPSTYAHPSHFSRWEPLLPGIRRDVPALMRERPERQWSSPDLLDELHARGIDWAKEIEEAYVLEHLLGRVDELVGLGRHMWGLRGQHAARMSTLELAEEVLIEAGTPLPYGELVERMSARRSMGPTMNVKWPLARTADGTVGLAQRDLGLDRAAFERLRTRVLEELSRPPGRVSPGRLAELAEECGAAVREPSPFVLPTVLASDQNIQLDAHGAGVRRPDVPRHGGLPPHARPLRRPYSGVARLSAHEFLELLERVGGGQSAEELTTVVEEELGASLPEPALRRLLVAAGWVEEEGEWGPEEE